MYLQLLLHLHLQMVFDKKRAKTTNASAKAILHLHLLLHLLFLEVQQHLQMQSAVAFVLFSKSNNTCNSKCAVAFACVVAVVLIQNLQHNLVFKNAVAEAIVIRSIRI